MMKKRYWIPLFVLIAIPAGLYLSLKLPVFGAHPTDADREQFANSIAFNPSSGTFENRRPELIENMRAETSITQMLKEWVVEREDSRPETALTEIKPDIDSFLQPGEHTKLIWLGHSSFLLNIDGAIVLVDPIFSGFASPVSFIGQRFQAAVLSLDDLPKIDLVLISHDHYDHLDKQSVEYFANKQTVFLTPLGVGIHLKRWGIKPDRIVEKDWWESHTAHGIEFTAAPSQHFSGRDGINNNETLWASWILLSSQSRLFYSGDSGYDTHFKDIGERYGPFDLSIIENGQYNELWAAVHLFPKETLQAHKDVKAERLMPVHWGMFELAFHTWYDPAEQLARLADGEDVELVTPTMGEVISLSESIETTLWWRALIGL